MLDTFYTVPGAPYLALLSDLHNRDFRPVQTSLERHRPDLICVTGDLIVGRYPADDVSPLEAQPNALALLRACVEVAPTFVSLGNHEWMLDRKDIDDMAATGAQVLDNDWVTHEGLVLGGLTSGHVMRYRRRLAEITDEERGHVRYPKATGIADIVKTPAEHAIERLPDDDWLIRFAEVSGYHILLSHHPEYRRLVPAEVELMLSGHAHGGQWRIFGHGVYAPGQGLWPRLTKGVYEGRLVVSAGLSNTVSVPRFFNPVEVVYVRG